MPSTEVNGCRIAYERGGAAGVPVVLVHGSWDTLAVWERVVPLLAAAFRVVAYDRRGHGASARPAGAGSVHEDAGDLAALIERLGLAPAWVVGNSFGGSIALRLAGERPDLLRGVLAHEPPLFGLAAEDPDLAPMVGEVESRLGAVADLIAAGDDAGAARVFVDTVAVGPGAWDALPPEGRETLVFHAPTFLDEMRDPDQLDLELGRLGRFPGPVLLTRGDRSPPLFGQVAAKVAAAIGAQVRTFAGAGHVPHETHPDMFAELVGGYIEDH